MFIDWCILVNFEKDLETITHRYSRFGFDFMNLPITNFREVLYPVGFQQPSWTSEFKFSVCVMKAAPMVGSCVAVASWQVGGGTWRVGCK